MKILRDLTALLLIILSAGCAIHDSKLPEQLINVPSTYSTGEERPALSIGRWWEEFGDEDLNSLIEEAFQRNPDISRAYERLQQSLAVLRIKDASRGIMVNVEGSDGRRRQAGMSGPVTAESYSLSAAAAYELDIWGRLKAATDAAEFDAQASGQDIESLYISVSAQVADLYYMAVEKRAQLDLTDQAIASYQDTLERVERRYREGIVPAIDLYQSRRSLSAAMTRRPPLESELSVTLNAISVLTGNFPDNKRGGSLKKLIEAPSFRAGLPSQLLLNRPDIRAALLRLESSDKRVAAAIADRFPSFNLIGSYGGASNRISSVIDSPNIFWNILLQVAQPLLDAGRRKAEVKRAEALLRENLALYHKTVLNAFREVEDALVRISASEELIGMLNETVSASDMSLRLAIDRYMQGLTDYLPVLSEQLTNFNTKGNLLSSQRQLISARIQLARALGGDWSNKSVSAKTAF